MLHVYLTGMLASSCLMRLCCSVLQASHFKELCVGWQEPYMGCLLTSPKLAHAIKGTIPSWSCHRTSVASLCHNHVAANQTNHDSVVVNCLVYVSILKLEYHCDCLRNDCVCAGSNQQELRCSHCTCTEQESSQRRNPHRTNCKQITAGSYRTS